MSDYTPPGVSPDSWTQTASAAVAGGQLLIQTGDNTVGPSTAGSLKAVGIAAHDAPSGGRVTVLGLDCVHETVVDTAGNMLAGDPVKAGGTVPGTIAKDTAPAVLQTIGVCIVGATATNKARWLGL